MKKRLLSVLLTLTMVLTLLPGTALAAPNDTEFHITGIQAMKDLVAKKLNVDAGEKITIHSVEVHGAKKNWPNAGSPATATGGTVDHGYLNQGDVGVRGLNGKLTGYGDIWMVLNDASIIYEESVTAITIYAKTDTDRFGYGGNRLAPVTVYLADGAISFKPLDGKLITSIDVTKGSLTPPVEKQIYVSFVDDNQTPIVPQVVIKAGESATAPTMDGNLPITGWMLNDVEYEGGFSYAELEELITVWGGTYENEGYLTFKAIYGDPIEKQIYVSFVDNNQTPIVDQVVIKAGESATAPIMDGNLPITGWMLNDVEYEGGFSYAELEELITVWGGTYENEGYLTFKAIYGDPIEKQIYVSFVDNNQTPIVDQVVIKAGESATAPIMDGNLPITGWMLNDVEYEGGFSYAELEELITVWGGTYENEGYLTFKAIYGDPIEKQIYVSFVDNNQTPIVDQVVIKAGESATAPIMDGNLPITGWMLNDVEYEGGFSYAELEELITVWGGTYENEGYLTFKAIYGDPIEKQIYVSFVDNNQTPIVDQVVIKAGESATAPIMDGNLPIIGWTRDDVKYEGGFSYAELEELITVWGGTYENEGYLTFKAIYGDPIEKQIYVSFVDNNQTPIVDQVVIKAGESATAPIMDGNLPIIGWTRDDVKYEGGFSYAELEELITVWGGTYENEGYLTFKAIYGDPEPAQRTVTVTFQINASDDHGIYDSGRDVVTYTWTDMNAMITPPTVVCDTGYEHVGWVLNGATTTELTVPNIEVDPNLAYFADGETTGYLTVYPVFKAVDVEEYRVIHVSFVDSDETTSLGGGDVISTYPDQELVTPDPAYFTPEDMTFAGWKVWVGNEPMYDGEFTYEALVQLLDNGFDGEQAWLTFEAVYTEKSPEYRVIHVSFVDSDETTSLGGGDVISTYPNQELVTPDPAYFTPEDMTFAGWKVWVGNEPMYDGEFTYEALVQLLDNGFDGEQAWLTFEAVYTEKAPEYRVIHVSFVDSDETTSLGSGDVISTYPNQELVTPDPAYFTPEDMTFAGWKVWVGNEPMYDGEFTYEALVQLLDNGFDGEQAWLTFEAVYTEKSPEYRVIHVSFVDSDETTSLGGGDVISTYPNQELVTPDPAYFTPEDMTFAGWKVWVGNEPMYDGEFTYEALVQLLDNGFDGEQAWLTFEAVYTEKAPEYRVIHVSFVDSDETTSLGSGDVISTYPNQELVTPDPAYFTPEDMTFAGWKVWVGNEPMYDGEFTYEALVQLLDNGFDGEQAWLTFEAVYTEKSPEYRVIHVSLWTAMRRPAWAAET